MMMSSSASKASFAEPGIDVTTVTTTGLSLPGMRIRIDSEDLRLRVSIFRLLENFGHPMSLGFSPVKIRRQLVGLVDRSVYVLVFEMVEDVQHGEQ